MERSKKKGFLAPLKGKEDPKQTIDEDAKQKKTAKSVPFKNQNHSSPEQNNGPPKVIFQRKKVKDGQAPLKKLQETVSAITPKSLTDSEYDDIFKAVLQEAINTDCDDKTTDDKRTESATFSKSEYNEKVANKCIDERDDLDSLKSEDVDIWTDSPPPTKNQKNENALCPLKSKCSVQKKAERNGSLKPKQLIFTNSESITEKKENKQEVDRTEVMARNHTPQIKKREGKEAKRADAVCGSPLFKKEGAEKQEKGQPGLKDKVKKRKKAKEDEMNNLKNGQNKEETADEQEEETGTWIQCSNKLCGKWRYVATIEDPVLVPALWECKMNSDKEHNSCDIPEVNYDESEHICTPFTIGSLVWAKMDGYPWWPGMIEPDPDYDTYFELITEKSMVPFQYHVTFFDDHVTRAWIRTNFIFPYSKGYEPAKKVLKGRNSYRKEIEQAVANADRAMALNLVERINTYGFSKRYRNNKKSKWRMKEYQAVPSKKSKKKGKRETKDNNIRCSQLETRPLKDHDTDDSLDDFSDLLEDSEYIPVKTKSRGLDNCNSLDESTETQDSKVKEGSSSEDEYNNQAKRSKFEDSIGEANDCKLPTETKFDPDVFTMEIDSAPINHHPHNNDNDKLREILCDTVERHTDINKSDKQHTSKNSMADMSIDYSHSKVVFTESTNLEDISLGDIEIALTDYMDANDSCEEITKKKKKGRKLGLKSKALGTSGKEECKKVGDEEEEKNDAHKIQKDDDEINMNCENEASTKENKKKSSKQEKPGRCDVACVGGNKYRAIEGELKMEEIHDIEKISSNQFHRKGSYQNMKKEHANLSNKSEAKDENASKMTWKSLKDTKVPTEADKENMSGGLPLENKKAIMRKNKTRETKKTKSEGDSDKENIEPSKEINQTKKANDKLRSCKKGLKRQAASSNNSVIPALKKQEKHETKQPKLPTKLEVPYTDQYVETNQNGNSKKEESDEEKQSQMKVSKRKCKAFSAIGKDLGKDEEQERKDKVNKKKLKSFAAPVKVCKSIDREVPQISSPNNGSNKDKTSLKSKTADCSLINDQHMVPDVTMGMESNIDSYLDIDTGYDENAGTKSLKVKEMVSDIRDNAKDRINDNNISVEEDEDVLDLDIDIQDDFNEPKNYVNSSEESDSADMEQLNLESVPHKQNVIVEEIKDLPPMFGRFAGRCAEHGSDSDPMELIED
ncbi:Zinc finger cw-type pwwp domain protein 1-like [Plakobranchus ocellatus]|uniref:Zinc finger cw-type pwwp domain protein 1-like n=1 Tax=Plakobranchus ocellatus TaxID=259542 RepID=A0AAV4DDJ9_9GAST|nr:Zinc finger cw-type pwwp domain protein 1-like [Plakobranchus ocellatus]